MNRKGNVLVTGGAGYIGSHCVRELIKCGYEPIVLDNLSTGHREVISILGLEVSFYHGEVSDEQLLREVFENHSIECVIHFAASCYVGESMNRPIEYYLNNISAPLALLELMNFQIKLNSLVFFQKYQKIYCLLIIVQLN